MESPRILKRSLTFGTFFFDYDLDGLPDLFAINGHVSDDISVSSPRSNTPSRRIFSATLAKTSLKK